MIKQWMGDDRAVDVHLTAVLLSLCCGMTPVLVCTCSVSDAVLQNPVCCAAAAAARAQQPQFAHCAFALTSGWFCSCLQTFLQVFCCLLLAAPSMS